MNYLVLKCRGLRQSGFQALCITNGISITQKKVIYGMLFAAVNFTAWPRNNSLGLFIMSYTDVELGLFYQTAK